MQLRINMETMSADGDALPAGGTLQALEWPGGPGIRIDGCAFSGYRPNPRFDSLLAKLVVHSASPRYADLVHKAHRALGETRIAGVPTNLGFLQALLADAAVQANRVDTGFVERNGPQLVVAAAQHPQQGEQQGEREGVDGAAVGLADAIGGPAGCTAIVAPMDGVLVELAHEVGAQLAGGDEVAVIDAMKMEHLVHAPFAARVQQVCVAVGQGVRAGQALLWVEAIDAQAAAAVETAAQDPGIIRADLAEAIARHAIGLDAQRAEAVAKRHKTGLRTARENIADLVDEGSFVEYGALAIAAQRGRRSVDDLIRNTPADGIVTGLATVNAARFGAQAARCAVLAYDYTVLAGTQGMFNHKKTDRLFQLAEQWRIPAVLFAEGGGGRPGDTDFTGVAGLDVTTFHHWARLSGKLPRVGIVAGRCFAGNAALLGCSDVIIATRDSSVGMGGPAMIEGGGLGVVAADEVGPSAMQSANGVIDVLVADEAAAVQAAKQYLSYFQGTLGDWQCADQRALRHCVPENRVRAYDMRAAIAMLADTGSVLELRAGFGAGLVTALVRIEGRPLGLIANNPRHLGGAIDAEACDKAARFLQLCDAFALPIVSLCDTPGFMVGVPSEAQAMVRKTSRLFVTAAGLRVPLLTIVLRKGYGLGAQAMAGGSFAAPFFTVAWPSGEFGAMGLEGSVRLGFRKELEAAPDEASRQALYERMVAAAYERGKALNMASFLEIDAVIDPAESRRWIARALGIGPAAAAPGRALCRHMVKRRRYVRDCGRADKSGREAMAGETFDFDWLVIGSGFGGSVSALRLAEKGYRVGVLERGRRYRDEDYAESAWQLGRFLWAPHLGLKGILRLAPFRDVFAASGSGVGGGSIVYANTLYRAKPEFFASPQWGALDDWERVLQPHYDTAERMLGVQTVPFDSVNQQLIREMAQHFGTAESFSSHTLRGLLRRSEQEGRRSLLRRRGPRPDGMHEMRRLHGRLPRRGEEHAGEELPLVRREARRRRLARTRGRRRRTARRGRRQRGLSRHDGAPRGLALQAAQKLQGARRDLRRRIAGHQRAARQLQAWRLAAGHQRSPGRARANQQRIDPRRAPARGPADLERRRHQLQHPRRPGHAHRVRQLRTQRRFHGVAQHDPGRPRQPRDAAAAVAGRHRAPPAALVEDALADRLQPAHGDAAGDAGTRQRDRAARQQAPFRPRLSPAHRAEPRQAEPDLHRRRQRRRGVAGRAHRRDRAEQHARGARQHPDHGAPARRRGDRRRREQRRRRPQAARVRIPQPDGLRRRGDAGQPGRQSIADDHGAGRARDGADRAGRFASGVAAERLSDGEREARLVAPARTRAAQPPLRERRPLHLEGVASPVGSIEPAMAERLHASGLPLARIDGVERIVGAPDAGLAAIAKWLLAQGLCGKWRDELLPVTDAALQRHAVVERAAVRPLGIATFAVHLIGLTPQGHVWVQQRALDKATDPGQWDTLVGGLVAADESNAVALERETWEEAGLHLDALQALAATARVTVRRPVTEGYMVEHIDVYEAVVPDGLVPSNQDGEVAGFACLAPPALAQRLEEGAFTLEAALMLARSGRWLRS